MANISNGNIINEDMVAIGDWTDGSTGSGVTSQVTFDSKSCMKLDTGGSTSSIATTSRDAGSFGARTVISMNVYCDAIGLIVNNDFLKAVFENGTIRVQIGWGSDGLFAYDGASWQEIGTNIVTQDTWQKWTFDIDWSAQTVDIYLDGVLQQADVDVSWTTTSTDGNIKIQQIGITTASRLSYIDWIKVGDDFESLLFTQAIIIT